MPTAKNGHFEFLIYAPKKIEDKEITFFNVLLLKYYKKSKIKK